MERWHNRIAVVTGASSGIGAAITIDLLKADLRVVGLARNKENLDEFHSTLSEHLQKRFYAVPCDVSDIESITSAFDWIEEHLGGVSILINNAGIFASGRILDIDLKTLETIWQTNVMGMINCCRYAFNSMKRHNIEDGHMVLHNSCVGHYVFNVPPDGKPVFNMYALAKQATVALTEILRQELREYPTKTKITSISPGLVDTAFVPEKYKDFAKLLPQDVSSAILYCLSTPPHVQIHELIIKPVGELF